MQIRIAPSIGPLEDHPHNVWETTDYTNPDEPAVFFGLYGLPDFYALWRHRGKRYIFWAGSDLRHFLDGYWLDETGTIRLPTKPLAQWISRNCESWVENLAEWGALNRVGIRSQICPSFLGNINDYYLLYQHSYVPKLYTSVSGNDFKLYGWDKIDTLALACPYIEFHLYGNTEPWGTVCKNVVVHGRVPKEQMNGEIKHMQGALRLTEFDGFSEILAKSVLWGQWPVSQIAYPHILPVEEIGSVRFQFAPNERGRDYYRETLNKFPWNTK